MNIAVNARGYVLNFLPITCAITHDISTNGTGLSFFGKYYTHHS